MGCVFPEEVGSVTGRRISFCCQLLFHIFPCPVYAFFHRFLLLIFCFFQWDSEDWTFSRIWFDIIEFLHFFIERRKDQDKCGVAGIRHKCFFTELGSFDSDRKIFLSGIRIFDISSTVERNPPVGNKFAMYLYSCVFFVSLYLSDCIDTCAFKFISRVFNDALGECCIAEAQE